MQQVSLASISQVVEGLLLLGLSDHYFAIPIDVGAYVRKIYLIRHINAFFSSCMLKIVASQ